MNIYSVLRMIIRKEPTKEVLEHIYKTIQANIREKDCYYTQDQIKELKDNQNNKFLKKEE